MTALQTLQQDALEALKTLLTKAATELREVHIDVPDSIIVPALVIRESDGGLSIRRDGYWMIAEWDLQFTIYYPIAPTLAKADAKVREIRNKVIDRLDTDITLGGTVHNTRYSSPWRRTGLNWGGAPEEGGTNYAGVIGGYTLVFKEGRDYA